MRLDMVMLPLTCKVDFTQHAKTGQIPRIDTSFFVIRFLRMKIHALFGDIAGAGKVDKRQKAVKSCVQERASHMNDTNDC